MDIQSIEPGKFHETIAINRQLGETYILKMKNNPIAYTGIPVPSDSASESFSFKVLTPKKGAMTFDAKISDIEYLVKK